MVRAVHLASLTTTSSLTISQMLWTRALPGTVVVIAALALPELVRDSGDPAGQPAAIQTQPEAAPVAAPRTASR